MIRYRICRDHACVLVYMGGDVVTGDILEYRQRLSVDPDSGEAVSELVDMRDVDNYLVDAHGIQRIVLDDQQAQGELEIARRAMVCDRDHIFGMLRMYALLGESLEAEVGTFRVIDEALSWLDQPQALLELLDSLKNPPS